MEQDTGWPSGQRFHEEKGAYIKIFHTLLLWKYDFYEHLFLLQGDWEVLQRDNLKETEEKPLKANVTTQFWKGNVGINSTFVSSTFKVNNCPVLLLCLSALCNPGLSTSPSSSEYILYKTRVLP